MNSFFKLFAIVALVGLISCNPETNPTQEKIINVSETEVEDSTSKPSNLEPSHSHVSIFEIPATDIDRASAFYSTILDTKIERMEFPGMEMGLFPYENETVVGVIMKGEGYTPSPDGVTIYLNAGNDLQPILDRIVSNGGEILVPKTPHADESGFFAIFLDTEGNRLGLHSTE